MKVLYTFLIWIILTTMGFGQLTITEISYNPPESGTDSLEYVELLNTSGGNLDLTDWSFTQGFNLTFANVLLGPDEYLVVAVNPEAMMSVLGVEAIGFEDGALTNGGEDIEISDAAGNVVDFVEYSDSGDWPGSANGTDGAGASIELCDVNSDNNVGANWRAADNDTGANADGTPYLGTPGAANTAVCQEITFPELSINEVTTVDANGVNTNIGLACSLTGTVYGVNLNPAGLQFFLIDDGNEGLGVFSGNEDFGYTVTEGDIITIEGTIGQFRGLSQINPTSLTVVNQTTNLVDPFLATSLNEATEGSLVRFESLEFSDISDETASGFNANFMDPNSNVVVVRIDNDVDLFTTFSDVVEAGLSYQLRGIGSQFDLDEPLLDGYQLLPRYEADIIEIISSTEEILSSDEINVFPNPVTDRISIELTSSDQITSTTISDYTGRVVYSNRGNQESHDISILETGVYTMEVRTDNGVYIQQLVKL